VLHIWAYINKKNVSALTQCLSFFPCIFHIVLWKLASFLFPSFSIETWLLYCARLQIKTSVCELAWDGWDNVAHVRDMRNMHKILVVELEVKISLGTSKCPWEDIYWMEHKETECEGVDWFHLCQVSVGCCEYGNELSVSTKDKEFLDQLSNYQFLKNITAPWG
jgi:hypothetical protein